MRIANPEFLSKFVAGLDGLPEHSEVAAYVETWTAAVSEIDVRSWRALAKAFDHRIAAPLSFSLGNKHRLMAEFDLADGFIVVKWVGRQI